MYFFTVMESCLVNHPKASSLNTITLGVRILTYERWEDTFSLLHEEYNVFTQNLAENTCFMHLDFVDSN
jgi:hypothetical protein